MSGTIEFDKDEQAYLRAASVLESRFPDAAKYLRELVFQKHYRDFDSDLHDEAKLCENAHDVWDTLKRWCETRRSGPSDDPLS